MRTGPDWDELARRMKAATITPAEAQEAASPTPGEKTAEEMRKAMQYERHFASQQLDLAREAVKEANRRLDNVAEWLEKLSRSIEDTDRAIPLERKT